MHDEIKILDMEKKPETFTVVFEVPGDKYDQTYAKRLTHSFPLKEGFLKEDSDGVKRYEKVLRKNYVGSQEEEKQVKDLVDQEREKCRGKKLCKNDKEQKSKGVR